MAQKIQVLLEDDLSGGPADTTVRFGLDGAAYEIDLSEGNADALRKGLAEYVERGRKVTGPRGGRGARNGRAAATRQKSADIRAWAKGAGIPVNERGRIPVHVVEQYEAAHAG